MYPVLTFFSIYFHQLVLFTDRSNGQVTEKKNVQQRINKKKQKTRTLIELSI